MSAGQEGGRERAEAADELASLRIQHGGCRLKPERDSSVKESQDTAAQHQQRRGGILSSIREGAKSVLGAVIGRTQEPTNQTPENRGEHKE